MRDVNPIVPIITLNVNRLIFKFKGGNSRMRKRKQFILIHFKYIFGSHLMSWQAGW